jgi:hypothetical protein
MKRLQVSILAVILIVVPLALAFTALRTASSNLEHYLDQATFWKLPETLESDAVVADGDLLMLEGASEGRYHLVNRQLPEPPYLKLCRYMLDLTEIDVAELWEEYHSAEEQAEN